MKQLIALFIAAMTVSCTTKNDPDAESWIPLFNGNNLDGWDIKITGHPLNENFKNTFRVEDGVLKASYDEYDKFNGEFGHLFFKEKYSFYKIRIEYRFIGDQVPDGPGWATRNSGVMIHSQPASSMNLDQSFPASIEVQFLGGLGQGDRPTGNLCTPGTNVVMYDSLFTPHCINSSSRTYDGDQWVTAEAIVLGDSLITHIINGDTVLSYSKPQLDDREGNYHEMLEVFGSKYLKEGYIALQAESHPIEFRKVELLNLKGCMDPEAVNYKSYHIEADNSRCVYRKGAKSQ